MCIRVFIQKYAKINPLINNESLNLKIFRPLVAVKGSTSQDTCYFGVQRKTKSIWIQQITLRTSTICKTKSIKTHTSQTSKIHIIHLVYYLAFISINTDLCIRVPTFLKVPFPSVPEAQESPHHASQLILFIAPVLLIHSTFNYSLWL
jgi:hypothetical protein